MPRSIFFVSVGLAAANAPPVAQQSSTAQQDWRCTELCRHRQDEGIGKSMQQCLTQCAIRMDIAPPQGKQDAAQRFVEDQSYNEKGGQHIKSAYRRLFGEKIGKCHPVVDLDISPSFFDVDSNGDGYITSHEAIEYGNKMCVPDEMTIQIFTAADASPRDGKITLAEFTASGEDTVAERAIDRAADVPTEGDNEYAEVSLPSFEAWDHDGDGFLTEHEAFNAFMHELKRRDVAQHDTVTSGSGVQKEQDKMWQGLFNSLFPEMDVNGDGKISRREFYGPAMGSDFGDELRESAVADEDAPDPDDGPPPVLPSQPVATAPARTVPSSMLRSSHRSIGNSVHLSIENDRTQVQELRGALHALVHHEDSLALSKTAFAHVVDKAIRLRKEAANHKNSSKFAHFKAI